jgi:hypothetical protein
MRGFCMNGSDILVSLHLGPVLGEHSPTKGINLNLPTDFHSRPL